MIPPAQLIPGLPHMPPIPNVPMNRMPMNFAMPMGFQMNNMAMNQHNLQMHQHMVRSQLAAQMRPGMGLPQMPMNVGPHQSRQQFNITNPNSVNINLQNQQQAQNQQHNQTGHPQQKRKIDES
ncbi:hypothetical protein AYI69_g4534 [Smittium culicis]|uniref:Uncharacterized protein n=1 Tax=Smittium culicis TaxID=133412 RepID=A0A1R1YCU0_9FUNG|nr:hypothetical protein AYI69_g4534 [Smittium culicis]